MQYAVAEQPGEEARRHDGFGNLDLGLQQEVDHAQDGDDVDGLMQPVPARGAKPFDHTVG